LGWRRELLLSRRWLAVFLAGFPLAILLYAWAWANRRSVPDWMNVATSCPFGLAGLGLYMFYVHVTRGIRELGKLLASPGLAGVADQTLTIQRLVPPILLGAFLGMLWTVQLMNHAGWGAFLPATWMLVLVLLILLGSALVGLPLYWIVSYFWLMRQTAAEVARTAKRPPGDAPA